MFAADRAAHLQDSLVQVGRHVLHFADRGRAGQVQERPDVQLSMGRVAQRAKR